MKRVVLMLVIMGVCSIRQADNSARIKDLTAKQEKVIQTMAQYQNDVQKLTQEAFRLQGAIDELVKQDKEVKEVTGNVSDTTTSSVGNSVVNPNGQTK